MHAFISSGRNLSMRALVQKCTHARIHTARIHSRIGADCTHTLSPYIGGHMCAVCVRAHSSMRAMRADAARGWRSRVQP